ncbi:carbohydrate esterase family 4 protein, partial [Tortispora caseinolytica NRRL Y-17796]
FPSWLTNITGLHEWPDDNPPYIDMGIDLENIIALPERQHTLCPNNPNDCFFDCNQCTRPGDIQTCDVLTQTFDDGPSSHTHRLLDHLETSETLSTFFLIGKNVVKFPDVVRRQVKEGHVVASHTWSHKFLPSLSNRDVAAQLQWTAWAIYAAAGVVPRYFRPPYGGIDDRIRAILDIYNLEVALWSKDTYDWRLLEPVYGYSVETVANEIRGWKEQGSGGIMLQHDFDGLLVDVDILAADIVGSNQKTIAECVG